MVGKNNGQTVGEVNPALIIGAGPSYDESKPWQDFDGTVIAIHKYIHNAEYVITTDLKEYETKEKLAIGKSKLIVGEHFAQKRYINKRKKIKVPGYPIPEELWKHITFTTNKAANWTSGIFAIRWAIDHGYNPIYTVGIDLPVPYVAQAIQDKIIQKINEWGKTTDIYKFKEESCLPVQIKDPLEDLCQRATETMEEVLQRKRVSWQTLEEILGEAEQSSKRTSAEK